MQNIAGVTSCEYNVVSCSHKSCGARPCEINGRVLTCPHDFLCRQSSWFLRRTPPPSFRCNALGHRWPRFFLSQSAPVLVLGLAVTARYGRNPHDYLRRFHTPNLFRSGEKPHWKKPKIKHRCFCRDQAEWNIVPPADVILFEGILPFYFRDIRNLFDMKLFVDTDADTRLSRRCENHIFIFRPSKAVRPLESCLCRRRCGRTPPPTLTWDPSPSDPRPRS